MMNRNPDRDARILNAIRRGVSVVDVAARFAISRSTVLGVVQRAGGVNVIRRNAGAASPILEGTSSGLAGGPSIPSGPVLPADESRPAEPVAETPATAKAPLPPACPEAGVDNAEGPQSRISRQAGPALSANALMTWVASAARGASIVYFRSSPGRLLDGAVADAAWEFSNALGGGPGRLPGKGLVALVQRRVDWGAYDYIAQRI